MKKILVVDDEKRLVSLVSEYLLQSGYRVISAYDGRKALEMIIGAYRSAETGKRVEFPL